MRGLHTPRFFPSGASRQMSFARDDIEECATPQTPKLVAHHLERVLSEKRRSSSRPGGQPAYFIRATTRVMSSSISTAPRNAVTSETMASSISLAEPEAREAASARRSNP